MNKRVVLHYDMHGILTLYLEEGITVDVLSVCEYAPGDRVYRLTPEATLPASGIDEIIGSSPVGHKDDDRHPALAARIVEAVEGKPRLSLVTSEEAPS